MKYAAKYLDNAGCEAQQDGCRNDTVGSLVGVGVGEEAHEGCGHYVELGDGAVDGVDKSRHQARIQSILKQISIVRRVTTIFFKRNNVSVQYTKITLNT